MHFPKPWRDTRHKLWLNLAKMGNEDAFRRLYRELYPPVASFVFARIGNIDDAEDVVGNIFMRFLDNLAAYQSAKGPVITWILAMARHAIIDHHRRQTVRNRACVPAKFDPEGVEKVAIPSNHAGSDPLGTLIRREELTKVRELLAGQPPLVRNIYALRYGQELKMREIAAVLEISEDVVKQRLSRTNRMLRGELQASHNQLLPTQGGPPCPAID